MISVVKGDNASFPLERRDSEDNLILTKANQLVITCKANEYTDDVIFQKKLSDGSITFEDGVYTFEINGNDTENLDYGLYYFDIVIFDEKGNKKTLLIDELSVTKHFNFDKEG